MAPQLKAHVQEHGIGVEYHLSETLAPGKVKYEIKTFKVGEDVELFANRVWKPGQVIRCTWSSVYVSYSRKPGGKLVVGRVDMQRWESSVGLSWNKIKHVGAEAAPEESNV